MNNIKIFNGVNKYIVYCLVDRTYDNQPWARELVKNQADYTITNLHCKGYTVMQGTNEDALLREAAKIYSTAVVFSTGTEFITGSSFFDFVEQIKNEEFFVYGHILDRFDAYYEIHQQCYVINLRIYQQLGCPVVGQQELGQGHFQIEPIRSHDNFHDNYTPLWVGEGNDSRWYSHKAHGWNLMRVGLELDIPTPIQPFSEEVRSMKKHYYPENNSEFLKHIAWAYSRERYCSNTLVYTENTETTPDIAGITQLFTPAAGGWWLNKIDTRCDVVIYDYNAATLSHWKRELPPSSHINYRFVKLDLLADSIDLANILDVNQQHSTFLNFSNIFAYEGTTMFSSLEYRLSRENALLKTVNESFPDSTVYMASRAITGFHPDGDITMGRSVQPVNLSELHCPTWHIGDWR
jgi:hypothetical protein